MILYSKNIDKNSFLKDTNKPKYGLPKKIIFCKRCVISNQRPSSTVEFKNDGIKDKDPINFTDGICDACIATEKKNKINWKQRELELLDLCDRFRKTNGEYDCLVPGSGGKDSFMQAHILKYKYKMNPLTVTWAPHIYTDWGRRNHQRWIDSGLDNILFTPNSRIHRLLTRFAVDNLFHPFQPFIIGQKNLGPQLASIYDINLVFYGENEAEYGNPLGDNDSAFRDKSFYTRSEDDSIYLGGMRIDKLHSLGISKNELKPYLPIKVSDNESKNIQVHYLGYYLKWHPQGAYYYAVENGGFESSPERTAGTYSVYNSIDDKIDDFHYHTTFIKFGYGRATEDAAQEIRSGDITRSEGVMLVNKYDGEYPLRWADEIFDYLSIKKDEFPKKIYDYFESPIFNSEYYENLCDKFRSPHIWNWNETDQKWSLRDKVIENNENDDFISWEGNN